MNTNTEPSYAQAEWNAFLAELERVGCDLNDADRTAYENDDDDLRGWMDDLQDRVGLNVDAARVLLEAYISASNAAIARDVAAMDAPARIEIVDGPFARIAGGNCTEQLMLDRDDDLEERARAHWSLHCGYYGDWYPTHVYERGISGFGVARKGAPNGIVMAVYETCEAAERALAKITAIGGAAIGIPA